MVFGRKNNLIPDLGEKVSQKFLDVSQMDLKRGIGNVTGEDLEKKLDELFAESARDPNLQKIDDRIEMTCDNFYRWLTLEKGISADEASSFCLLMFRVVGNRKTANNLVRNSGGGKMISLKEFDRHSDQG